MAQQDIQISVPIIGVGSSPVAYADQILDEGTNMTLDKVAKKSVAYGPYASVAAAHTALSDVGLNTVGTTVGISGSNNTVVEYWYQGGTAQANLVKKVLENSDINAIESSDGKIYSDYQAGDIFYIEENDVRKYRVALVAGTADAEHPVTISPVNFYYALNSADAINLSLTLKTVSTEQQSLSSQQKAQARSNIATIGYEAQTLTAQQKEQAAQNIGLDVVVKGDVQQSLSDAQKVQAQNNMIGKAYNVEQFSGLGKKILTKNIQQVSGVSKNVMTQAFFQDEQGNDLENTVFVIQYDYTLGENITIPAGCTLQFDGGSISGNSTLTLTKTNLSGIVNILCNVDGTVENSSIDITWFGCKSSPNWSAENDCTEILQLCVDLAFTSQCEIFVPIGDFVVNDTVYLHTGTIMKGVHGYTFKVASRLCTSIQTDDYIMFRQKNSQGDLDAIRHCTFEGITFSRNRTSEEKAGGRGSGEGYGLAGTIFKGFTELRLLNCGVFGFGKVFHYGAICFCDHTDFAYTNTIVEGSNTSGNSAIYVENANIWCCGNIVTLNRYSTDEIIFDNVWIEYAQSLCSGVISTKVSHIIFHNMWFSNAGYNTNPNLLDFTGTVNPNTPTFVFKNCSIKNKGQICKSVNPATSVNVTFEDCYLIYGGDYSLETCNIYGNSMLRDYQNEYNFIGVAANKGIDNHYAIVNNGLQFKRQSDNQTRGEFAIFRNQNILQFYDGNNNHEMLLHAYWLTGDANDVTNPQQAIYLTINPAPSGGADVLALHNKVTGQNFTLKTSNSTYGTTAQRPTRLINGMSYFDSEIIKPIWVIRDQFGVPRWVDATGKAPHNDVGLFADRPASGISVGTGYFATDKGVAGIGAMIYYTGDSTTPWVYADGTAVS